MEPFVLVKDIPTVIEGDDEYAVRRMTPKECFRLMGFDDADFELLVENGISNTQLYKMAGNSISVNMLEFLFCQIFDSNNEIWV
ncbi:MAG: DNA cytosine methyltransferase [Clostridia bacterium]|nr:DNA cytosine methyltransferase [Clostridia bacterium]